MEKNCKKLDHTVAGADRVRLKSVEQLLRKSRWTLWAQSKVAIPRQNLFFLKEITVLFIRPFKSLNQPQPDYLGLSRIIFLDNFKVNQIAFTAKPVLVFDCTPGDSNLVKVMHKTYHDIAFENSHS